MSDDVRKLVTEDEFEALCRVVAAHIGELQAALRKSGWRDKLGDDDTFYLDEGLKAMYKRGKTMNDEVEAEYRKQRIEMNERLRKTKYDYYGMDDDDYRAWDESLEAQDADYDEDDYFETGLQDSTR